MFCQMVINKILSAVTSVVGHGVYTVVNGKNLCSD